jgi:regulator of nonsense transcripts 1
LLSVVLCCVVLCRLQVCIEMVKTDVPEDTTVDYSLEFVWKSTSFDRMNTALKLFKDYSASISGYLFHVLLGHEVGCPVGSLAG